MSAPSKKDKRTAPILCALVLIALIGGIIAVLLWLAAREVIPAAVVLAYTVCYTIAIVLLVVVLVQRLKEIAKGEEDEVIQD